MTLDPSAFNAWLAEAYKSLAPPEEQAMPTETLTVKRMTAYLPISTEQALDAGLITEEQARAQGWTPYVPPKVSRRSRLRWWWAARREQVGRKVGGWIAGVDLSERGEDW